MNHCIFCFKSEPEVKFSQEHLIPKCIGGNLILDDYVCAKCNSKFGAEFDHNILKKPEIVAALSKLKIPHKRVRLINNNFRVKVFTCGIEFKGRATENDIEVHPQQLKDGSLICPETEYKEPLLKGILRDQRLRAAGLTIEDIKEEFQKLTEAYNKAEVGENVTWSALGVTLVKRSDIRKIKLEPKGSDDISRLVAKIAYEFGFIFGYRDFLLNEHVAKPLHRFILTGKKQPSFHVTQISTNFSNFVPIHFISFQTYEHMTRIIVGFFGTLAYMLIAPPLEHKIFQQIAKDNNCSDLIGIEYQQDMHKKTIGFWAILPDGTNKLLATERDA